MLEHDEEVSQMLAATVAPEVAPAGEVARFAPEPQRGKVEYKLKLSAEEGSERFEELVTQLNFRMRECSTEEECEALGDLAQYRDAIYRLGVADDGHVVGLSEAELDETLGVLRAMAARIPAVVTVVSRTTCIPPENRTAVTALVRAVHGGIRNEANWHEVRICTVGNVDSGKSTLLGVLTQGLQDDGRGRARSSVFRHRHELKSGRTSSIANLLLGFDESGRVVNYHEDDSGLFRKEDPHHNAARPEAEARVAESASKLITFSDLCGHEKYFKTTLVGMVGLDPDYLLCTIDANRGEMRGMVHEHLLVANALAIPTIICLTKCDMAAEESVSSTLSDIKRFLKQRGSQPFVVKNREDVTLAAERILQGYTPIVPCSAVTGAMIPEVKLLLNLLPRRTLIPQHLLQSASKPSPESALLIRIEDLFPSVPGVGLVVSGRVVRGTASVNDNVRVGPVVDAAGTLVKSGFSSMRISSMRFEGVPVEELPPGTIGTFALKAAGKAKSLLADGTRLLRHVKVLLGSESVVAPSRFLKANVTILQHPSSIRPRYEPVLHIGMVRQAARVVEMRDPSTGEPLETLRAGDSAEVLFKWAHWPEVLEAGSALVFRESRVKGIGKVTWVGDKEQPKEGTEAPKASKAASRQVPPKAKVAPAAKHDNGVGRKAERKAGATGGGRGKEAKGGGGAGKAGRKGKRGKR